MNTKIPFLLFLTLGFATVGSAGLYAQQPAAPSKVSDSVVRTRPAAEQTNAHRKKRGGPQSPSDEKNATPAEGQNDLIKVLQPGSRQKNNQ